MESWYKRNPKPHLQPGKPANPPSAKPSSKKPQPRLSFKNLSTPSTPYTFTSSKIIGMSNKAALNITKSESRVKKIAFPKGSSSVEELNLAKNMCFSSSVYDANYVWNPQKVSSPQSTQQNYTLENQESRDETSPAFEAEFTEKVSMNADHTPNATLQEDEGLFSTKTTTRPISRENNRPEHKPAAQVELYGKVKLQSSMSSVTKFKTRPNFAKSNMEHWKPKLQSQMNFKETDIYKSSTAKKARTNMISTSPPPTRSLEGSLDPKRRSPVSPAKPSIYKRLTSQKEMSFQSTPSAKKSLTTSKTSMFGTTSTQSKKNVGMSTFLTKPKVKADLYNLPRSKKNTLADIGILPKESSRRTAHAKLITDSTLTQTTCEPVGTIRATAEQEPHQSAQDVIDSYYAIVFGCDNYKRDLTCSLWNSSADLLDPPNPHGLGLSWSPYSGSSPSASSFLPGIPYSWVPSPKIAKMIESLSRGLMDFYNRFPAGAPIQGRKINLAPKKDPKSKPSLLQRSIHFVSTWMKRLLIVASGSLKTLPNSD